MKPAHSEIGLSVSSRRLLDRDAAAFLDRSVPMPGPSVAESALRILEDCIGAVEREELGRP